MFIFYPLIIPQQHKLKKIKNKTQTTNKEQFHETEKVEISADHKALGVVGL